MLAFSRITSVLFFVLPLSFFAYAAPTPAYNSNEVAPSYEKGQYVLRLVADLHPQLEADLAVLAKIETVAKLDGQVDVIVAHIDACAKAIAAVAVGLKVEASICAQIAAEVAACITLLVNACLALIAKFGVLVVLTLLAKIDICLHALLVSLSVCVVGILDVVVQLVVKLGVSAFAETHLGLCMTVLKLVTL